ncbi:translation machinery-associated protein 16 [Protopterus annectens]|uniref:translation machinery-associated protein 16 n=1 Tax=Protopterus annectens TaxID=7888 RepID=UPI001CFBA98B|nr:translation machinery-associated protein 16 [Protopterus annectens]
MPKAPKGKATRENKVIHPYSRKAAQLTRDAHKQEKKEKQKTEKALRLHLIGEKFLWFQNQLDSNKKEYSKIEACYIIERYLHRFDSELEQIALLNSIKGRQGRQHNSRENVIKQTIERETLLYQGYGLEIPDIINSKNLQIFREWNGDLKKLPHIKTRKISIKDLTCTKETKSEFQQEEQMHESSSVPEEKDEEFLPDSLLLDDNDEEESLPSSSAEDVLEDS